MRKFSICFLIFSIFFLCQQTEGKRVRQKLKAESSYNKESKKKSSAAPVSETAEEWIKAAGKLHADIRINADSTATFNPESVRFVGYDKQAGATRENFHIVNGSSFTLRKIEIEIVYLDMKGRMLHKRKTAVWCHIPPGETRMTDIKSWDTQNSFYYHLSNPPRRIATPYQVNITPITFWLTQ